ncbi:MAG: hypothetical protein ACD_3C00142G0008 [uncultured bacterium (gcode 4)]|uniref:EamA domain-containing protein n=1 Tax=uncultured bacterium (gcode 4) TaxID=1234023 RepID=K2G0Y7_9BACT|nr:MAG: hypothetical protein ACD_3C00142G0008 [uncultured bacterium (gcode 4)]
MIWWILNAFLWSLWAIFWKKSLELNKLPQSLFMFLWMLGWFILSFVFIFSWLTNFPFENLYILIWMLLITIISIVMWYLWQYIYREEKMSVLLPYSNIDKIIIIIVSFFYFQNASIISFFSAILATAVVIYFSLDFKELKFPKNFSLIMLNNVLSATKVLYLGWLFLHITSITFYSYNTISYTLILFVPLLFKKEFLSINKGSKEFYSFRLWAAVIGQINALIWFFLLAKLWVLISNLLWFLTLWVTLLFWYLVLKDTPKKNDVIQAVLVSILVAIGYYFK